MGYCKLLCNDHEFYVRKDSIRVPIKQFHPQAPPMPMPYVEVPFAIESNTMQVWMGMQVQGYIIVEEKEPDEMVNERLNKLHEAHERSEKEALLNRRCGIVVPK